MFYIRTTASIVNLLTASAIRLLATRYTRTHIYVLIERLRPMSGHSAGLLVHSVGQYD